VLVLRITYFIIGKVSTWVGTVLVSPEYWLGSKPCDSGITLHDDSKRRSFTSCESRAKRTKFSSSVFQRICPCSVNVPSNTRAGYLRRFVAGPVSQGGVAVVSRPEHISMSCTEKSPDSDKVQRSRSRQTMSPRVSYNNVSGPTGATQPGRRPDHLRTRTT
jgi:hypothetical protein